MNNSIEDIIIDKSFDKQPKKSKVGIVIFVILLILVAFAGVAYYYYNNFLKETNKELFFKGLLNNQAQFFYKNETYVEMAKKFATQSFEMNTDVTFSTTKTDNLELENQDFSKYLLNWSVIRNLETEENYNELNLSYSDNKILNIGVIDNKDKIAIISDEIVNKYIGVQKNNAQNFFSRFGYESIVENYDVAQEKIDSEKIEIDTQMKDAKIQEYKNLLIELLGEEKFSSQENSITLKKDNFEEVLVEDYKLTLSKEEYISIVTQLLTKLRTDEELIKQLVTNMDKDSVKKESNIIESESTENVSEITGIESINTESTIIDSTIIDAEDVLELYKEENNLELKDILISLLLGKKIDATVADIQAVIDDVLAELENVENGLEITIYVSEKATEKITVILPDKSTIDVEFESQSEIQKNMIITYLYEEELLNFDDENSIVYSADGNEVPEKTFNNAQTNGFKIEISKLQNDVNTEIDMAINIIEDKKINKKLFYDIITKGTPASKNYNNEIIAKYSDIEGETNINIKNKISFDKMLEVEDLTEENCLLLDTLDDETLEKTMIEISDKIIQVITDKKQSLNFIDTNTQAPEITPHKVNRDELRNLLVSEVSIQMGDAMSRGETYTLENLLNLQISGHVVSVVIQENIATVTLDGIRFNIDANFNLSDAE